jgi:serine protease inhibitor
MMEKKSFFLLLVPFLLLSCSNDDSDNHTVCPPPNPINWTSSEMKLMTKNTDFGVKMFTQLCSDKANKNDNVTFSPVSMEYLLGMIANGANDGARKEMLSAMGYDDGNLSSMNSMYTKMTTLLMCSDTNMKLALANAAWIGNNFTIRQAYRDSIGKAFNASISNIDFANTGKAQDIINHWCEENTNGMIKETPLVINSSLRMVLANATYFKGSWTQKFDKKNTAAADFTCADGNTTKVNMMNRNGYIAYSATDDYQMVVLPYGNGAFAMTLILPKEGKDINQIANTIDWARTDTVRTNLSLYVPKFKVENLWKGFEATLQNLGINKIFTDEDALPNISSHLFISAIAQSVCIDVNEDGTEAAAVSMGGFITSAGPEARPEVKFNRPFLFAIKEQSTGTPLFIGRISKL